MLRSTDLASFLQLIIRAGRRLAFVQPRLYFVESPVDRFPADAKMHFSFDTFLDDLLVQATLAKTLQDAAHVSAI